MRILLLTYAENVPPEDVSGIDLNQVFWKVEHDVLRTLQELNHEVRVLGVYDNIQEVLQQIVEFKPKLIFNLMDDFDDESMLDQNVPSFIELLRIPYTGCNPRGLMLTRDKALSKSIVKDYGIRIPRYWPVEKGKYTNLSLVDIFPVIVKSRTEDASIGITQASVVRSAADLVERVERIWQSVGTDAIIEEYIVGREIYVGVFGNKQLRVLPPWELKFGSKKKSTFSIATDRVKWSYSYRKKNKITSGPSDLEGSVLKEIQDQAQTIYQALGMSGYGRIDFRLSDTNQIYFIEANANPHLAEDEDFAESAKHAGFSYPELIQKIINLGCKWEVKQNPVLVKP